MSLIPRVDLGSAAPPGRVGPPATAAGAERSPVEGLGAIAAAGREGVRDPAPAPRRSAAAAQGDVLQPAFLGALIDAAQAAGTSGASLRSAEPRQEIPQASASAYRRADDLGEYDPSLRLKV